MYLIAIESTNNSELQSVLVTCAASSVVDDADLPDFEDEQEVLGEEDRLKANEEEIQRLTEKLAVLGDIQMEYHMLVKKLKHLKKLASFIRVWKITQRSNCCLIGCPSLCLRQHQSRKEK